MSDLVPLGRLRYRPLHLYLLGHWHPSRGQLSDRVVLDHPFLDPFLYWLTKPSNVLQGMPLQATVPQLAIYTDASANGWEAHCDRQSAAGLWVPTEVARHISELELLAVLKAVIRFLPLIRGKIGLFQLDNSSAVAYLRNQGARTSCPCST